MIRSELLLLTSQENEIQKSPTESLLTVTVLTDPNISRDFKMFSKQAIVSFMKGNTKVLLQGIPIHLLCKQD